MKIIKPLIIVLVIAALVVGGTYGGYRYNQSKKVAQVCSMDNLGMDGYWGDTIQSYGDVTSEKAQSAYIAAGTEILSVNVAEGDHVNEGDVLMTVRKDSQDINGKILQIQKAEQALKFEQIKLSRLENTTPIPEHMGHQDVYRDISYVSEREYILLDDVDDIGGKSYSKDDVIAVKHYSSNGEESFTTYLTPNGHEYDEEEDKDKVDKIKEVMGNSDLVQVNEITQSESWLESILYWDYDNNKIVGEDIFDRTGKQIKKGMPEGPTPSELKNQIEEQTVILKRQDLAYKQALGELESMKNTNDNGEILAKVSGTVSKCQSIDNFNSNQPFMVVSATDEYFISGSIGEFYLDKVNVGDTVQISCWENGNTADAVITEISDTPSDDGNFWGGDGNTNTSNYKFKASFDRNSGIEIGSAVDITITPAGQEAGGFYIPSYLIRKDSAGTYVMKMNESNVLEKKYIKVGKNLWGSMTEVKEGVVGSDYLAFPYGSGAIEGVTCEIVDYFE